MTHLCSDLTEDSVPLSYFCESPCHSDTFLRRQSALSGIINRTFTHISCPDSLSYTVINTQIVADTGTSVSTVQSRKRLFLMLNPSNHSILTHVNTTYFYCFSMISQVNRPLKCCTIKVRISSPIQSGLSYCRKRMF